MLDFSNEQRIVEKLRVHRIANHKDPSSPSPYIDCAPRCGHARKVA